MGTKQGKSGTMDQDVARKASIRAIVVRVNKAINGRYPDHIGPAIATVVGELCLTLSKGDLEVALGGVDALARDAKIFVRNRLTRPTGSVTH